MCDTWFPCLNVSVVMSPRPSGCLWVKAVMCREGETFPSELSLAPAQTTGGFRLPESQGSSSYSEVICLPFLFYLAGLAAAVYLFGSVFLNITWEASELPLIMNSSSSGCKLNPVKYKSTFSKTTAFLLILIRRYPCHNFLKKQEDFKFWEGVET